MRDSKNGGGTSQTPQDADLEVYRIRAGECVTEEGTINTNFVTRGWLECQCERGKTQPVEERKKLKDSGFCRHYDSHESHTVTLKS